MSVRRVAGALGAVLAVAVAASCGGEVVGQCFCSSPEPEAPPFAPPDFGRADPGVCGAPLREAVWQAPTCEEDAFGGQPPGGPCATPRDCASVCCVPGGDGIVRPTENTELDGGTGADADTDADAEADAETNEAAPPPFRSPMLAWACSCRVCPSREETCALQNEPGGLGGP
jgi:hypothetical protein